MAITTTAKHGTTTEQTTDDELTSLLHQDVKDAKKTLKPVTIMVLIILAITFLQSGDQLMDSPMTRLIESVSCYHYWEDVDPSRLLTDAANAGPGAVYGTVEKWCKADSIQAEVAMIRSYQLFLESIPALALAVPFGWLQDKYGRRPFLIIGMLSFLVKALWIMIVLWYWRTFELRWTWASSLHALMMGGTPVVIALYYTIIADITTEKDRATFFLRAGALNIASAFITPPITAWLMMTSPWLPVAIGLSFTVLGFALSFLVPETLGYRHPHGTPSSSHPPSPVIEAIPGPPTTTTPILQPLTKSAIHWLNDVRESFAFLWVDYRVPLLILPFLTHLLSAALLPLLVQYASKRYDWTIAMATIVVDIRTGAIVVVLFSIMPFCSNVLITRYGYTGRSKDLLLTRVSILLMAIGWTLIGISPTAWLFVINLVVGSLSAGAMFTLRSLLTSLVPDHYVARAYSIASIVDTLGLMFGAPFLARCYKVGMHWGGLGIGLPFFVMGGISFAFVLLMMFIKLRKDETQMPDMDDEVQ